MSSKDAQKMISDQQITDEIQNHPDFQTTAPINNLQQIKEYLEGVLKSYNLNPLVSFQKIRGLSIRLTQCLKIAIQEIEKANRGMGDQKVDKSDHQQDVKNINQRLDKIDSSMRANQQKQHKRELQKEQNSLHLKGQTSLDRLKQIAKFVQDNNKVLNESTLQQVIYTLTQTNLEIIKELNELRPKVKTLQEENQELRKTNKDLVEVMKKQLLNKLSQQQKDAFLQKYKA